MCIAWVMPKKDDQAIFFFFLLMFSYVSGQMRCGHDHTGETVHDTAAFCAYMNRISKFRNPS